MSSSISPLGRWGNCRETVIRKAVLSGLQFAGIGKPLQTFMIDLPMIIYSWTVDLAFHFEGFRAQREILAMFGGRIANIANPS
jgi:hypothetical protein